MLDVSDTLVPARVAMPSLGGLDPEPVRLGDVELRRQLGSLSCEKWGATGGRGRAGGGVPMDRSTIPIPGML